MIAHNGVPVVLPLKYPLRISGISLSFLEVDIEFFPGALLFISLSILSRSSSIPEGRPSIFIPIAFP